MRSCREIPKSQIMTVKGVTEMDELLATLEKIGIPEDERMRVREYYGDDLDGMSEYVLYMRAMLDDRYEYVD